VPIEIKLSSAVDRHDVAGLRQCMSDLGLSRGYVVANTTEPHTIGNSIDVVPWAHVVARKVDVGLGRWRRARRA